jgi:hypothetical protein
MGLYLLTENLLFFKWIFHPSFPEINSFGDHYPEINSEEYKPGKCWHISRVESNNTK